MNRVNKRKQKTNNTVSVSEEASEVIRFVKVLGIVILVVVALYFFTRIFVTRDLFNNRAIEDKESEQINIDYNVTTLGALFTRPYDEYYVLVYSSESIAATHLSIMAMMYRDKEDSIKLYTADLSTPFNQSFYSETETTPNATSVEELRVGDTTLIMIRNGKIVKFIEDIDLIAEELGVQN